LTALAFAKNVPQGPIVTTYSHATEVDMQDGSRTEEVARPRQLSRRFPPSMGWIPTSLIPACVNSTQGAWNSRMPGSREDGLVTVFTRGGIPSLGTTWHLRCFQTIRKTELSRDPRSLSCAQ